MLDNRSARTPGLIVGLLSTAILAGCAPLAQAPLVYSSKSTFGLDVSATSTETPGVSFSIGSKQVDAAYVPVAVAIPCPKATATTAQGGNQTVSLPCAGELHKLVQVTGKNTLTNSSSPTAIRYQKAQRAMEKATDAFNEAKSARDRAEAKLKADEEAAKGDKPQARPGNQSENGAQALTEGQAQETTPPSVTLEQEKAKAASERLKQDRADLDKAIDKLTDATRDVQDAKAELEAAESTRSTAAETKLEDAYSVFGTFDGKGDTTSKTTASTTTTEAPALGETGKQTKQTVQGPSLDVGGGLKVGKMFSTGIASQHLAAAAKLQSFGACMEKTAATLKEINALTGIDNALKAKMVELTTGYCPTVYRTTASGHDGQ